MKDTRTQNMTMAKLYFAAAYAVVFVLPLVFSRQIGNGGASESRNLQGGAGTGCFTKTVKIKQSRLVQGGNNSTIMTLSGEADVQGEGAYGFQSIEIKGEGTAECAQQIVLTQNKNSLISFAGACGQKIIAITGGTGKFVCARGQAEISDSKLRVKYCKFC